MPSVRQSLRRLHTPPSELVAGRSTDRRSVFHRFSVSVLSVAAVVALRYALNPLLGHGSPFLLFTPAVMLAAWYGGLWPGLLATALSTVVGAQFLGVGRRLLTLEDVDRLALFMVVGVVVTWLQVKVNRAAERITALLASESSARAEAEAASRSKDEFLALVSHELRTPLSVIIGWSTMLEDHVQEPESVRKAAEVIGRNARLQHRLVDDLLDSVRATRGTMRLECEPVDLAQAVSAAVDAARPAAAQRGIGVRLQVEPGASAIWGDPARLHQVFMNLLGNATKFTTKDGTIHVRLDRAPDAVRVTVSDTGAGIERELLPRVFDRFTKGRHSDQGLGLGLSLVRDLVEMHGGTVAAASPGPGRGSSFVLTFPLLPTAVAPSLDSFVENGRAPL